MVSEALVLGGGLAGGAAAVLLARAGVEVRLLEREASPTHKVCGEFLSVEARQDLCRLGLDPARLGGVPIDRLRLVAGTSQVEAKLPFVALGLSRKLLDEALLDLAAGEGARIERGVRVTGMGEGNVATSVGTLRSGHVLLATGKHDVRGARRIVGDASSDYVGFKLHFRLGAKPRNALAGAIDLILFDGGYAGLQLVSHDVANLCLVVRKGRLARAGGNWDALFADLLREPGFATRLDDAQTLFPQPLTVAKLPYGYLCDPRDCALPGLFRIGDQGAKTASLSGDGMAIALRTAHLAASAILQGATGREYHQSLRKAVSRQVGRAMLLQKAAELPSLAVQAGFGLLRIYPGLLGHLAKATRLPQPGKERM